MQLSGLEHSCRHVPGGIAVIRLALAADVVAVHRNASDGSVEAVELAAGSSFVLCNFAEASATLLEEVLADQGAPLVSHSLSFSAQATNASRRMVAELATASVGRGVVALVETASGETLLVGYSDKFGVDRALKLSSAKTVSGAKKGDRPLVAIVLQSADTSPSMLFTGRIP